MSVTFSGAFTFTGGGFTASLAPPPSTPNAGWFVGGTDSTLGNHVSTVQRITYATDTATASIRGPLYNAKSGASGVGTVSEGWYAGGQDSSNNITSTVQRITYATDTATGTTRGPLSAARYKPGQAGDSTAGWVAGGSYPDFSTVSRITYATDTDIPSVRGPLTYADTYLTATSGIA